MAHTINKLTDADVKSATKAGRVSDGGNLNLRISKTGGKSWGFRYSPKDKNSKYDVEIGLGAYPALSLKAARRIATQYRDMLANGLDPKLEIEKAKIAAKNETNKPTFEYCVDEFLKAKQSEWKNAKHRAQWRMTLTAYCNPIARKLVSEIDIHDVLKVLQSHWQERPETASRLRGRIERVLNYAKVKGWRTGENPAMWRGNLENVLSKPEKLTRGHHAALPYSDIPKFMERLSSSEALSARALELLIYTACRSGEVLNASWTEIDIEAATWVIPAERMKAKIEHRIPLTAPALAIIESLNEIRLSKWVFPGQAPKKPLSNMAMTKLLQRMKINNATPHGFRSSFRDWAGDETSFPREIAEGCLAHVLGSATERAYRRGDALQKRRELLEAWANYCTGNTDSKVVRLHG